MISNTMLQTGRGVNGAAFFIEGMQSGVDPMFISDRAYRHGQNVLNRGGMIRTRPGYREVAQLPEGNLQGMAYYRPISGTGSLVVAVEGDVYAAPFPFTNWTQLPGIELYRHAPRVFFSVTVRSARREADGTISTTAPTRTLVMQDGGFTRAAYWDGGNSGHISPSVVSNSAGEVLTAGTPLGSVMAWSGDRLWVASGGKLFASDISDPLSFVENQYAAEGGFFSFEDDITALAEEPSLTNPALLVFTRSRTYRILSGVRDRSTWKGVPNFQSVVLPDVGCVGHRAVTAQHGELWWMSATGLVNLNSARQAQVDSRLSPQDTEMTVSKFNLASDLGGVALAGYENYLLCSVPYADKFNSHTWVRDFATVGYTGEASQQSWASIWTGTRPVEWAVGPMQGGLPRCYYVSKDYDGYNRLWEAFTQERTDNGQPIRCFVETKQHLDFSKNATGLDLKQFVCGEVTFGDVLGNVDVSVYYAGSRGKYKKLMDRRLVATEGSVVTGQDLGSTVSSNRSQTRRFRSPDAARQVPGGCTSQGIESTLEDWVDVGFSLLVEWQGDASLRSYRIFADPHQEPSCGDVPEDETGPKVVAGSVCE